MSTAPDAKPVFPYTGAPVYDGEVLVDVSLNFAGKTRRAFGKAASAIQQDEARQAAACGLTPIFLGAGLGHGIEAYLEASAGELAVIDRQEPILAVTKMRARFEGNSRVRWIKADSPEGAAKNLAAWLRGLGFPHTRIIADPIQLRLDPGLCQAVRERVLALDSPLFRQAFGYKKFAASEPRVLMLSGNYFLRREIEAACDRLGYPLASLPINMGQTGGQIRGHAGFIERFLETARAFQPDFVLTVNHLGLDREGAFAALLERLRLPLASWFVDSPRLILHDYTALASPYAAIFTWNQAALPQLSKFGFEHVSYLPLATDESRFAPGARLTNPPHAWRAPVSFVGESMRRPAADSAAKLSGHPELLARLPGLAAQFAAGPEREARERIALYPEIEAAYHALPDDQTRLDLEMSLTWEATRLYRQDCVRRLMPFAPLIVGDAGWKDALPGCGTLWRWHPAIDYYRELPDFYQASDINFNCTSMQMKGAVNQRVFDAPACGAFVLTDYREQLEDLFEIGRQVAVYRDPSEIEDIVRYYLAHESERTSLVRAARTRVLAQHTYVARLQSLAQTMRGIYS